MVEDLMSTNWLITWNPAKWQWPGDMLPKISRRSMSGEIIAGDQSWSVSNTKRVQLGDKVYLMRQGRNQPGLVASGIAYGSPYPGDHWNESGDSTNYIDIAWTAIIDPDTHPPLPRDELKTGITDHVNWSTQRSGISIDNAHPEAAHELEKKWEAHLHQVWGKAPGMEQRTREAKEQAVPWRAFNTCRRLFEKEDWQGVIDILTELAKSNPFERFHILLGDAHYGKDEYEKAIEAYNEAIKVSPQNLYALSQRATCLEELGKIAEAEKGYDEIVRIAPGDANAWFDLSCFYSRNNDHKKALESINEALRLDPDNDLLLYLRSSFHSSLGKHEKAIEDYDKLLQIDPEDPGVLLERGETYRQLGEYDKAIIDLSECVGLYPDSIEAHLHLGNVYYDQGEYDKALELYSKALKIEPDNPIGHFNRGTVYSDQGEYDRAIEEYNRAIELDPEFSVAYYHRGCAYKELGELDNAISDFSAEIKLDSTSYVARSGAYLDKAEYDKAIEDLNEAIELDPDNEEAYNNRGLASLFKEEPGKAIEDFNKSISLEPDYAQAYYNRGWSHLFLKELGKAKEDFDKVSNLDKESDMTDAYKALAEAHIDNSQANEAIDWLSKAIAKAPDSAESAVWHHLLGKAYQSLGDEAKAEASFSKAKDLGYTPEEDPAEETEDPSGDKEPPPEEEEGVDS